MTHAVLRSPHAMADWWLCVVREALTGHSRDPIGRAYVAAGAIAWDDCCGMLVVAPESVYRSVTFPTENTDEENCYAGDIAMNLLILLVRCVPVVDDRGRAPSGEALDGAYRNLMDDAAVIWNAVTCVDLPESWMRSGVRQSFVGANGGCIGIETRLTVGLDYTNWRTN